MACISKVQVQLQSQVQTRRKRMPSTRVRAAYHRISATADPSSAPSLAAKLPYRRHLLLSLRTHERRREAQGKQPGTSSISGNAPNVNDNNARTIQKCKIKCKISSNRKQHNQSARHQSTWNFPVNCSLCRRVRRGRHADNATQPRWPMLLPAMRAG